MTKKYDDEDGVWRTIGGRRIFIKNGQDLASAMKESGKFSRVARNKDLYKKLKEENKKDEEKQETKKEDKMYKLPETPEEYRKVFESYREKRDKLEGIEKDELGNRNYDTRKDATWTGKEYTNDEFLENLEDENWHTERKMLLDANLTDKQMEFVKDNTTFHNGSPSLDKKITEELIKGAKGEQYRKPTDILSERKNTEISGLEKELKDISQFGKYDDSGNYREGVKQDYQSYSEKKERYKQLTGKDFDDSNIKIPYDDKKTYEYPGSGIKINQDYMKERYSGVDREDIQHDIDFNKSQLMNYSPKQREIRNAEIKEMEKYLDSLPKYESRISDEFGTKDWKEGYSNQFGGHAWKGTKSDSGLYGKDKIKAIDDEIKKAYPGIKTSRHTGRGGYTDSFSYSIMESDKPIVRDISDFSDTEIERLWNKGYNKNYYKTKEDFKESLKKELESGHFSINEYNIKDDYRLTPYGKQVFRDINKVSNAYNYDESESQVDYFNTGHYMNLSVGKYDKPYKTTTENKIATTLRQKAYQKYMKEHPNSKMTFDDFMKK